jgi:hypothetical protein
VVTEEWTQCSTARHEGIGGMEFLMLTARVTEELLLTHSGKGFWRWNEGCWIGMEWNVVRDDEAVGDEI